MSRVLLTGATGSMGSYAMKELVKNSQNDVIRILVRDSDKNRKMLKPWMKNKNLEILWGDLTSYENVYDALKDVSMVLHVAAYVSPAADYYPKQAMKANYGGTKNLVDAIHNLGMDETCKFVYIGTIAETGDRMPPIHWGRIGDPIKPSVYDYYAVSKVAAERYVIESSIANWVSLRQTGIIGEAMSKIKDAIAFHNCLNNVLEYISDRDSGILLNNLWHKDLDQTLDSSFWNHIYNIGGGESCRASSVEMYEVLYPALGIKNLDYIVNPKLYATRNFHGQYYLDSDKLNDYLDFRHDSMYYFYNVYKKNLGAIIPISKFICKFPGGEKMMGESIMKSFDKDLHTEHGTLHFIEENLEGPIKAYWGSKEAWEKIPNKLSEFERYQEYDKVVPIDHGYDETKPQSELSLDDVKGAAIFRGGECLSETMTTGDWKTKLEFKCAFGHTFNASPRLVLEGGHWCPICEKTSWNYGARAKVDPFFAQVWYPLHDKDEDIPEYIKEVNEDFVNNN